MLSSCPTSNHGSISRGKKKLALSTCRSAILTNFLHYNPRPQQTLRTFFDTMKIGGCQVVIKCGGVAMREHRPDVNENGSEITCYLASQPGKEFYIEYSRDLDYGPPNTELSVDVYFGGVFDGPGWIAPDPSPRAKKVVGEIMGSRQGDKIHTYAFSKPEIIDGETPSTIDPDRVGEIKVVLGFIESRGTEVKPNRRLSNFGPAKVNEKDKKPGAHCAGPMSKASTEECTGQIFFSEIENITVFTFTCRSEEWLEAEGIIRKRRRRGETKPAGDSGIPPLLKSEPVEEEVAPIGDITPDDEPVVQSRKRRRPVSRPTGQEEQKLPPAGADITPERPRKVLRRSANVTSTVSKTTGAPEKDSSSSKVKVEESISVPKVKEETTEVKVDELNELDDIEKMISQLKRKKASILQKKAASSTSTHRVENGTGSPQPEAKTERG